MSNVETNKIRRKLFDKLKEFYPEKDFVCGVVSNTKNDDDIPKGVDVSSVIQYGESMLKFELFEIYENIVGYRYYPEGGSEYGKRWRMPKMRI